MLRFQTCGRLQNGRRVSRKVLVSFLVAVLLLNVFLWRGLSRPSAFDVLVSAPGRAPRMPADFRHHQTQLWSHLHSLLEEHAPNCSSPVLLGSPSLPRFDAVNDEPRRNYITNSDELLSPMQTAHDGFVRDIRGLQATGTVHRAYVAGTEGIVSAAGGRYLPVFVVSLLALRRTGSKLPVELFVKDWIEYEPYACEVVLPPLNAKCVVLSEVLQLSSSASQDQDANEDANEDANANVKRAQKISIENFQIKSFAVLFSSFEKAIWMDADTLLIHNPTKLLNSEPFVSTGLLTWPDFWANTVSPLYYSITRQPELPMTARQATESGLFIVSKTDHFLTLLLAAYYNYYGPSHYYRLLGQGAPGEGDKDTFIQAAAAVGEEFHTVSEPVEDLGHPAPDGGVLGAAMLQADPIQDYALTIQGKRHVKDPSVAKAPRGFFINANNPTFNPADELLGPKSKNSRGDPSRLWTARKETLQRLGYDAEKLYWEQVKTVSCSMERVFETWKPRSGGLCEDVRKHWEAVFENPSAETPKFREDWSIY